jgi:hypothetical protein
MEQTAEAWPPETTWPIGHHEHAVTLSRYLRETLVCIDRRKGKPVPLELVKFMIMGTLTLINKSLNIPDVTSIDEALQMPRNETESELQTTTAAVALIRTDMQTIQTTVCEVAQASRKMKAMIAQMAAENGGTSNRADGIAS